jgi:hypothetical protein
MCSDKASRSLEITLSNSSASVVAMAFAIKSLIRSSRRFETKTKLPTVQCREATWRTPYFPSIKDCNLIALNGKSVSGEIDFFAAFKPVRIPVLLWTAFILHASCFVATRLRNDLRLAEKMHHGCK